MNSPIRFRKDFDVVHLNWHRAYDRHDWFMPPPFPMPTFHWLAKQASAASVTVDLLHPFDPERPNPYSSATTICCDGLESFSPHVLYYVVLATIEIHLSAEEAAQAGVFGALGEEPIRLVDPRDTATVAKFRDVWRCRQSLVHEEPDVAEFFSSAIDAADAYHARVEQLREDLEKGWLWFRGTALHISNALRQELWPNLMAENEDPDGNWYVKRTRRKVRREHPWVRRNCR